jgi:hypothetical protein
VGYGAAEANCHPSKAFRDCDRFGRRSVPIGSNSTYFLPLDLSAHFCYFPALLEPKKERCMKSLAIILMTAVVLVASGCRHDYNPTPPPYYCQPTCGCAPACAPACNPCAPTTGTTPYLNPTPATIPRAASGNVAPAPNTGTIVSPSPGNDYRTPTYLTPSGNTSPSLPR